MEQLTSDSMITIALAIGLFAVFKFMPRILAWGIPFHGPETVKARIDKGDNVLVIDVRSSGEFTGELGHVPGSLNLEAATLAARINELGDKLAPHKNDPVVVTCRTHNRSPRAAKLLKAAGFSDVSVLKGGLSAWNRAGYQTERRA